MTTNNSINSPIPTTVVNGGTGLVTLTTAYGVVCAGTTATGNLQNAGAGTSGQALVSGGASALPAYRDYPAAASSWSPSYTGFSSAPSGDIAHYQLIGKICFIYLIWGGSGTSNATTFTITNLPFTCKNYSYGVCQVVDAGVGVSGLYQVPDASTTLTFTKGVVSFGGGGFTATGTKGATVCFFYEVA